MRLLLVCVSFCTFVPSMYSQADNQPKVALSGIVMNSVTGEPVRNAIVTLQSTQQKTVMTGADGHFQMDAVPTGYASISAHRPGFDQQHMTQQRINVQSGMDTVVVKLSPLSKISGRIFDREGEPIEGIAVHCLAEYIVSGRKQWQMRSGATSDETGNFVIEDLSPGTYILGTQEKQLYFAQPKSEAARYIYPPTFYPDSSTRDLAQLIDLKPGEDLKVDLTLHSARGTRISFTTVPSYPNVFATLTQSDDQYGTIQAQATRSGLFTFPAVPPGSWKIVAHGSVGAHNGSPTNEQVYGELPVEVGSNDLDSLKVPVGKELDIPVVVSPPNAGQIYLQLFSKNGMVNGSNPEQNGELKIRSVAPGTYQVVTPYTGGNYCISSMMYGSQDLLHDDLTVAFGSQPPPIQVVLSTNCAQLTATTSTAGTFWVLIVSESKRLEPRMQMGNSTGLAIPGLAEGDYRVYAFDDGNDLEYANPDALRQFKSQTLHLEPGQKATVQLEVNERHQQ